MCDTAVAKHNEVSPSANNGTTPDMSDIQVLAAAFNSLNNYTSDPNTCVNLVEGSDLNSESFAWNIQICSQLPMIQGGGGNNIFWQPNFYEKGYNETCMDTFQLMPNYPYALDQFGGRVPTKDFYGASNIIWSNGEDDPWSRGGILQDISPNMEVIVIKGGAHHYDLRLPKDETDTAAVKDARAQETEIIKGWIAEW